MKRVSIGLIGGGTVGANVLTLLHRRERLFNALGFELHLLPVVVRDLNKRRPHEHPNASFTTDASVLQDADVILEMIGGTDRTLERLLPHLNAGKPVITANKAMLAECWSELKSFAVNGQLYYEASVMAGTPVIGPLTGTLRSSNPLELHAILSGTCNYILTRMEAGVHYDDALQEAQAKGYAEDPPTLDVSGTDAAHKLCVLARVTVDPDFDWKKLEIKGIDDLNQEKVLEAVKQGKRVKLIGSITPDTQGWRARVRPVLLEADHPLAQSDSSRNAMVFNGDASGVVIVQGGGAGGLVTASAMVGDLIDHLAGVTGHEPRPEAAPIPAEHQAEEFEEI
jgi:homoserine dehydrogenase